MPRTFRTSLAVVLLLALPLASLVASGHHHRTGGETAAYRGGGPGPGVDATLACTPGAGMGCPPAGDDDQPLCPICELAKSLHAAGPPAPILLPTLGATEPTPPSAVRRAPASPPVSHASRSPPAARDAA